MEQNTSTTNSEAGKGMGVAGLVVGILATLFSFIPCLGAWAIIPGIVGLILSAVSMKQAGPNGQKGMAIGGLITSLIGIAIACYWLYFMFFAASAGINGIKEELEKSGFSDSLAKAFKQAGDSLTNAMKKLEEIKDTSKTH